MCKFLCHTYRTQPLMRSGTLQSGWQKSTRAKHKAFPLLRHGRPKNEFPCCADARSFTSDGLYAQQMLKLTHVHVCRVVAQCKRDFTAGHDVTISLISSTMSVRLTHIVLCDLIRRPGCPAASWSRDNSAAESFAYISIVIRCRRRPVVTEVSVFSFTSAHLCLRDQF